MKKICIVTSTRAEYGLLRNVIFRLSEEKVFDVRVAVTGTHLSVGFGNTCQEIKEDNVTIDKEIPILEESGCDATVAIEMGKAICSFGEYFASLRPDMLIVLGDRYETIAICLAAVSLRIPIAHIHGGEKTEGAFDDAIRHAITKLSFLHFTATEEYRKRVIQLGENPSRVYCVGALSVENIKKERLLSKAELENSIAFCLGKSYGVVTFHPVTLEKGTAINQLEELVKALVNFPEMHFLITKANSDTDGRQVNCMWEYYARRYPEKLIVVDSLGMRRYLSALKYAAMVIGNSSSGIIEAPMMKIPTVNIGDRQKGRLRISSIIDCKPEAKAITVAMKKALEPEFLQTIQTQEMIYGTGNTSIQIAEIIKIYLLGNKIDLKKKFYDIPIMEKENEK